MQVQGSATARGAGRGERKFLTSVVNAHNARIMSLSICRDRAGGYLAQARDAAFHVSAFGRDSSFSLFRSLSL